MRANFETTSKALDLKATGEALANPAARTRRPNPWRFQNSHAVNRRPLWPVKTGRGPEASARAYRVHSKSRWDLRGAPPIPGRALLAATERAVRQSPAGPCLPIGPDILS